jgi:hypothetical protein
LAIPEVKVFTSGSFKDPLFFYKLTFSMFFLCLHNGGMNTPYIFILHDGFIHPSGVVVDGRPVFIAVAISV